MLSAPALEPGTDLEERSTEVDVAIIGGGPVGLYGAYCGGFRGLRTAVIDTLREAGGQVTAMYPEKPIYDIAGFPAVKGRDLVARLVEQAARYDPRYFLGAPAVDLKKLPDGDFIVETGDGCRIHARSIVISAGIGSFTPRPLAAARAFEGRGLRYFVSRLADMQSRDVVIVGGGDSALDWAMSLQDVARSVTLVHRRASFRAHAATVAAVHASSSIDVVTDAQVSDVSGDGSIEAVTVTHRPSGESREIRCQELIAALGFIADLGPMEHWGIRVVARHIVVDSRMETNVPGVYAAGDVTEYPGKVRIISVGFGEAATAVNNAAAMLNPSAGVFPGHSSEM